MIAQQPYPITSLHNSQVKKMRCLKSSSSLNFHLYRAITVSFIDDNIYFQMQKNNKILWEGIYILYCCFMVLFSSDISPTLSLKNNPLVVNNLWYFYTMVKTSLYCQWCENKSWILVLTNANVFQGHSSV